MTRQFIDEIQMIFTFQVDRNTFVCVKHFTERDILQTADRSIGQKARLRFGSIPRLLLGPVKTEIISTDDLGEIIGVLDECSTSTKPSSTLEPITAVASSLLSFEDKFYAHKCPECTETFSTSAQLINHAIEWHKRKRSRLKASELLKNLKPSEVIQSSDSDCDYEITYNVKRIPKVRKKARLDDVTQENEAPMVPLTPILPSKPIIGEEPEPEPTPASVILITVPPFNSKPEENPTSAKAAGAVDDLEDILTSSLIMKPKKAAQALLQTEVQNNTSPTENETVEQPLRNIMIASINSDGQIIETMATEDDTSHIIEEDYTDLDFLTEEYLSPVRVSPPKPKPPKVHVQLKPQQKVTSRKSKAATKEIVSLPPVTIAGTIPEQSDYDSDEEAGDGAIRKCLECKMCKWMFLSSKKLKKHLTDVHRLMLPDSDVHKFTKAYPYKNIKPTNGVRAFACSVCLRMYSNVNALKKHQIIQHSSILGLDDKPGEIKVTPQDSSIHVCHVCRKSFLDPENLRSHLLLHVDGKIEDSVYKCDQCGLGFEYEAALTKHTIENHATLRLYSCEYCNDAFASSADLYEHVQEHVSKNDQPTNNASNEGSNISELYLACPEDDCDLAFKDSNSYYWHILYEHRKVYQDDPKFIEFLQMVDPETLTQEEPVETQPEKEPETVAAAVAEQQEAQQSKSQAVYMDPSMRFTCKLCDRKVKFT